MLATRPIGFGSTGLPFDTVRCLSTDSQGRVMSEVVERMPVNGSEFQLAIRRSLDEIEFVREVVIVGI